MLQNQYQVHIGELCLPLAELTDVVCCASRTSEPFAFTDDVLCPQHLSEVVHAAAQCHTDFFVVLPIGVYRYERQSHSLRVLAHDDHRQLCVPADLLGRDPGRHAPVRIVYSGGHCATLPDRILNYRVWSHPCNEPALSALLHTSGPLTAQTIGREDPLWRGPLSEEENASEFDLRATLHTLNDVRRFAHHVFGVLGCNYHPDEEFGSYLDDPALVELCNKRRDECWQICTDAEEAKNNIYSIFYAELYNYYPLQLLGQAA